MTAPAARRRVAPPADDLLCAGTPALRSLAARQHGVVTRAQLRALGVGRDAVRARVDTRRWRSMGRRVVVVSNAPLSDGARSWAAVLLVGKPCGLAGLSAAAAGGLSGFDADRVHIVVGHDTGTALPPWVKVHESRRLRPTDLIRSGGLPPRTSMPRSLIDAATWSRWPRRAGALLCAGVQQRLTTASELQTCLRRAGHVRHVQLMRDLLGDIAGGGHTLAEIALAPLAARAGLAPPRRQVLRRETGGRVRYVDAEFDLPDGTSLTVEIDGSVHLLPARWWDDLHRQNEIVIGGRPVLRFPSVTVRLDPEVVVDQLRRMRLRHS